MTEPTNPGASSADAQSSGAVTYVLAEIRVTPDGQHSVESDDAPVSPVVRPAPAAQAPAASVEPPADTPSAAPPAQEPPLQEPPTRAPADELPAEEPPAEEPPIVRHDPFASMRGAPWMDRRLSPSGRAAYLLRRELAAFPVIEGRDPNHADLDAIVKRTVDYIVPIIRREQATDAVYDVLEEQRQARIAKRQSEASETGRPAQGFIKVSGGSADLRPDNKSTLAEEDLPDDIGPSVAQLGSEALDERIRSRKWSEPSSDREYLKSLEQFSGREVRLPDGSRVPDPYSPTGHLMSPVEDLRQVAAAGRAAGKTIVGAGAAALTPGAIGPSMALSGQANLKGRAAIAQGGEFDYQRKAAAGEKSGFVQLRQFWNVSNFNVGLFMQQAGFSLEMTLWMAGKYAWLNSSNYRPNEPDGLHPRTREFIELGHKAGASGAFD